MAVHTDVSGTAVATVIPLGSACDQHVTAGDDGRRRTCTTTDRVLRGGIDDVLRPGKDLTSCTGAVTRTISLITVIVDGASSATVTVASGGTNVGVDPRVRGVDEPARRRRLDGSAVEPTGMSSWVALPSAGTSSSYTCPGPAVECDGERRRRGIEPGGPRR